MSPIPCQWVPLGAYKCFVIGLPLVSRPCKRQLSTDSESEGEESTHSSSRPRQKQLARNYILTRKMCEDHIFKLFISGPRDVAKTPHKFYCRICNQEWSLRSKGASRIKRHFQSSVHLLQDQKLRLSRGETVYGANLEALTESQLQELRDELEDFAPVELCDSYPLYSDLFPGRIGAPPEDATVMSYCTVLVEYLRVGGPLELINRIWTQMKLFEPTLDPTHDISWRRDESLVSICYIFHPSYLLPIIFALSFSLWSCQCFIHSSCASYSITL